MPYLPPRIQVPRKSTYKEQPATANETCRVCGRECLRYNHTVELDTGSRAISRWESTTTSGEDDLPDSLGMYPIGPACARWLRKEHPDFYEKYVYA